MNIIKISVPQQLHHSNPATVCKVIVEAFSTYYEHVVPTVPPNKLETVLSNAAYMQKLVYQLISGYNGREFKKAILVPVGAEEEFLLEGEEGFETTIRTFNLVWDSYLYYCKERRSMFEFTDLFGLINIRDGIITLIVRYYSEWLIGRVRRS